MSYKPKKQYRYSNYDYILNGAYFITICTKDRKHYFGKIDDNKMILSVVGKIVMLVYAVLKMI